MEHEFKEWGIQVQEIIQGIREYFIVNEAHPQVAMSGLLSCLVSIYCEGAPEKDDPVFMEWVANFMKMTRDKQKKEKATVS